MSDNADHLKHLAAKALHCGTQPEDTDAAFGCIQEIVATPEARDTAQKMVKDNPKYVLPRIYAHGEGKIALAWQTTPEMELLLVLGNHCFELFKLHKGRVGVHREYVGYSGGALDESIGK